MQYNTRTKHVHPVWMHANIAHATTAGTHRSL